MALKFEVRLLTEECKNYVRPRTVTVPLGALDKDQPDYKARAFVVRKLEEVLRKMILDALDKNIVPPSNVTKFKGFSI